MTSSFEREDHSFSTRIKPLDQPIAGEVLPTFSVIPKPRKKKRKKKIPPDISSSKPTSLVSYRLKGQSFTVFDYYRPVQVIGSGAYAVVIEATDMRNGTKVAIKKNHNIFKDLKDTKRILREMKLLMHFSQDDVIKLLDVIPPADVNNFQDVFLVMPCCESNLETLINSDKILTDTHVIFFTYQILRGLRYIHSGNIVHRDIKPANILINGKNCKIKITDFGLARGVNQSSNNMTEYVVTRWYRAPEIICSNRNYCEKIDIWAAAAIFGELFTRKPIMPGTSHMDQLKVIFETLGKPVNLNWISNTAPRNYVRNLTLNTLKPTLNEKLKGYNELGTDLIKKCLKCDPIDRLSASDCLAHPVFNALHDPTTEATTEPYHLSWEDEASINTEFGLRHVIFESLTAYHTKMKLKKNLRKRKKNKSKESSLFKPKVVKIFTKPHPKPSKKRKKGIRRRPFPSSTTKKENKTLFLSVMNTTKQK